MEKQLTSVEICAGAGGQALGLEQAGFHHRAVVEIDDHAVATLRSNRPEWNVIHHDVLEFDISPYTDNLDLFAGGVPCPPFSIAGKQLGQDDERDLFPRAIELIASSNPKAVLLENVKGLAQPRFAAYRDKLVNQLAELGYQSYWELVTAADYRVPQLRPRFILVALKEEYAEYFAWPTPYENRLTVGQALEPLMGANGWPGAKRWALQANAIGPTLVGGSKKHGGPDVGPTRAREAWKKLGVRGTSIAEEPPHPDFPTDLSENLPRLTVKMGAVIQGFPPEWKWEGGKTAAWKQVGNAFPPPVAHAIGVRIASALRKEPLQGLSPATAIIPNAPLLEELSS
ncbi:MULTISPECIES: DNA cytosine methyltransferase [unclassified Corynebacterium]|uniref:DNA cytosine methyltransferase n=1 Tax=unclassified Corynebacterium TaxID=2624378 RepID=UPI000BAA3985|nr:MULTISPECIES: DNA (cytosine-5-)-methyltransferase [unclassified Corynebacterium]PAT13837.1 DNA (cytosine-5-)-methyltransferase [Corynebacterium sp. NML 120412]